MVGHFRGVLRRSCPMVVPMADLPNHGGSRTHQDAGRFVLAGSFSSPLPFRDPALAKPTKPMVSLPAERASARRSGFQPHGGTWGAMVRVRPANDEAHSRRNHRSFPRHADPERQFVFPQLVDDRAGACLFGRQGLGDNSAARFAPPRGDCRRNGAPLPLRKRRWPTRWP